MHQAVWPNPISEPFFELFEVQVIHRTRTTFFRNLERRAHVERVFLMERLPSHDFLTKALDVGFLLAVFREVDDVGGYAIFFSPNDATGLLCRCLCPVPLCDRSSELRGTNRRMAGF
jgi:hypothetical protein